MRFMQKEIESFVAAAETASITRTSMRVGITQASISAAVSRRENEFHIRLFIGRHAQGRSLTPEGQHYLSEAKSLLLQGEELIAGATETSTTVGGRLGLGGLTTLYPLVVPEVLQAFTKRHPAVRIDPTAGDQADLSEQLRTRRFSLALTCDRDVPGDPSFAALMTLPPFAFFALAYPLATGPHTAIEQSAEHSFLLLDLPIRGHYVLSLFHRLGLMPSIAGRSGHMEVIPSRAARGEGCGRANAQPRNRASSDGGKLREACRTAIHGLAHWESRW